MTCFKSLLRCTPLYLYMHHIQFILHASISNINLNQKEGVIKVICPQSTVSTEPLGRNGVQHHADAKHSKANSSIRGHMKIPQAQHPAELGCKFHTPVSYSSVPCNKWDCFRDDLEFVLFAGATSMLCYSASIHSFIQSQI